MSQPAFAGIILAAGKGTRMKSDLPKVLHEICGLPMVEHVGRGLKAAGIKRPVVIVGFGGEQVQSYLGDSYDFVWQHEQLGTGHAVLQALPYLQDIDGPVIICCGDTPLIGEEVFKELIASHQAQNAVVTVMTSILDNPHGYGRLIRGEDGFVTKIVEQKDATSEELAVREINAGLYCFDAKTLVRLLPLLTSDNAQGEYYITDLIGMIVSEGGKAAACISADPGVTVGINDRWQLAETEKDLRRRILKKHALNGVTLKDSETIFIGPDVELAPNCIIEPCTFLVGTTKIGSGSRIGPNSRIENSTVGDNSTILMSQVVDATVGSNANIGPFANLRPHAEIGDEVRIGNFVEVKNASFAKGAKANHLSYIGDATVGPKANLGAGTITCNYDGFVKSRTTIGADAFVGSNSTLVAPVTIGDGAMTAAGSVITKDIPANDAAFGRARQENKEGWASAFREKRSKAK